MEVNATHPEYDANLNSWLRARDVLAGEDMVKAMEAFVNDTDTVETRPRNRPMM